MTHAQTATTAPPLDMLIVGAGLSGIGMACYLQRELPGKSWAIAEARPRLGGTWDLFRYPGIRSDSDLYTFSYPFKPWTSDNAIASAQEILDYLHEAVEEYGIEDKITYDSRVISADWHSASGLWHVTLETGGTTRVVRARWLFGATGYYDYDQGYRPDFAGEERFGGQIVHAQHWPEDLDPEGKRIAVIGSGATAVTLVPALAGRGAQVTQVQRTPSYVVPLPQQDGLAKWLRKVTSEERAYAIIRWRNARLQWLFFQLYQRFPRFGRWHIRHNAMKFLPADFPYDVHFNPPYKPWDQRLCVVPDGDLFTALSDGRASMVTGRIAQFTETGLEMENGDAVDADIVVLATGLNIKIFGGIDVSIDGTQIDPTDKLVFKGLMLDGVPNFAFAIGYTNSSWTLKIGLGCGYLCKLMAEMDARGQQICTATRPEAPMPERPLMDFGAGYVQRAVDRMPRQGDRYPWQMSFSYIADAKMMRNGPVLDPALKLSAISSA